MTSLANLRHFILFGAPVIAVAFLLLPSPAGLTQQGWIVAVTALFMALWWMTEIVPLAVTALVPLVVFPLLRVLPIEDTAASYAHPLIFLFLGGFMLARAMECWGLHRRLAMQVVRVGGKQPTHIVASLMTATAFLSLWISNTAAAMVMLPIGASVIASTQNASPDANEGVHREFGAALMLGIGYAATIGGMGSLIGTPPNALFAGFMAETYGIEIGFAQWMMVGLPIVIVLLPTTWLLLTRLAFNVADQELGQDFGAMFGEGRALNPMSRGEKRVAILMCAVAALWIIRPVLGQLLPNLHLSDPGIAIVGAILLFVVPSGSNKGGYLLRWEDAVTIRWDILILFGGGLALAGGIGASGLATWIGESAAFWSWLPSFFLVAAVSVIVVYLGELASNTAVAAVFLPVAGAVAIGMGEDPLSLALPITLAASLGFMLPVATPPNAIVFGSGAVTARQMLRAGAILDLIAIVIVIAIGAWLAPYVFASA